MTTDSMLCCPQNANWQLEIDRTCPSEWNEALAGFHDGSVYQTWEYGSVRWPEKGVSRMVLKEGGRIAAMAQVRIAPIGRLPVGAAQIRWGPVCQRKGAPLDGEVVCRIAKALYEEYVERRGLLLRVLPNAVLGSDRAAIFGSAFRGYRQGTFASGETYRTIILNLTPPLDVLRKNLDQKWRNQLNRAERNSLTIVEGEDAGLFQNFIGIYDQMWARKRFAKSSDVHEFARMQEALPKGLRMRILIALLEGIPAAGVVTSSMGDSGIYLFGATSDRGMSSKGSYALQWRMIQRLKESGAQYYNLGGINPETNPGVYHFKAGFSGDDVRYMPPLIACNNPISAIGFRVAFLIRASMRRSLKQFQAFSN